MITNQDQISMSVRKTIVHSQHNVDDNTPIVVGSIKHTFHLLNLIIRDILYKTILSAIYLHVSNPVDLGVFHSLYYNLKIDVMSLAFIQNDSLLIPIHCFDTTRISSECLFTVLRTSSAARRTIAASQQLLGLHISFFILVSVISWEI